ncbi:asparagine synthase (glutamine-hydrolyzing) [Patulibacter defluvii]|uniref:asparagine synthase (glutamine-hydrolyzing) n=1 Tax=Patulibacter defluvii TaxID=3095358 RepID=UPI002A755331|nr:asparagine synthase (glutamine-hydrolyzing) [Patulibacter sp. DM4]
MCGVTGWVDWGRDLRRERPVVEAMTDTMVPRGPDAAGVWLDRHVALGHRRLAIIDLEGGVQPMVARDAEGTPLAVITYSGEVYNHRELRAELTARGHGFRTRSDTEVVLRAYLEWGADLASHLNGMFAFAVWDVPAQELLLVRDRLGIKPLYYAAAGAGALLFGSEPKAILANPLFAPELDHDGIAELFALATAPTPGHGVYRGLRQVRPGHLVRVTRGGVRERRWWQLPTRPHLDGLDATALRVRGLVAAAVGRQLQSDVPLGFLLSGGIDSSALVALAARQRNGDGTDTYSVDFPPDEGPERLGEWNRSEDQPYVDAVVGHVGTSHRRIVVAGRELARHRGIGLDARDLPGWGEPDTSLYLLFRGVREHATVALSGEVADEVFGGYSFFHDGARGPVEQFPWLVGRRSPVALLRPEVRQAVDPDGYVRARLAEALDEVPALAGEPAADARARTLSYLALTRWLPAVLERKDRMSMATALEARVPFADHHVVEYLWNVPWELKTTGGEAKGLLRRAIGDVLPDAVLRRPKSGYPATSASAYGDELRERVGELLERDARVFELVDRDVVARHLRDGTRIPGPRAAPHPTGGLDFLLTLDRWLDEYGVRIR